MKPYLKIISFMLLLFLLTAEDCSDYSVDTEVNTLDVFHRIENEFVEEEISNVERTAFEKRAIQKFKDVNDYINIAVSETYPTEFRAQALLMIDGIFYSKTNKENYYRSLSLNKDSAKVLLQNSGNCKIEEVKIDSVVVLENLEQKDVNKYGGKLLVSQKVFCSGEELIDMPEKQIEFLVIKTQKEFGTQNRLVWYVFLGEIE